MKMIRDVPNLPENDKKYFSRLSVIILDQQQEIFKKRSINENQSIPLSIIFGLLIRWNCNIFKGIGGVIFLLMRENFDIRPICF